MTRNLPPTIRVRRRRRMAKSGWNPASQTVSDGERMTATISTQQLTKRYGHTTALDSLDLEIEQGEVFGYLGPNGAGKSTTISLLLGLIHPTSGGARIFDMDVWRDARPAPGRRADVPSEANPRPA